MKQPGMDQIGLQCSMIEGPILPEQPAPGGVKGALSERKPSRRPVELRAQAGDRSHETSTAVVLLFPLGGARRERRRGAPGDMGDAFAGKCGPQRRGQAIQHRIAGSAVIDYAAAAFVVASVAFGPVLVWFLFRMAH
jgi:hypothetical protein